MSATPTAWWPSPTRRARTASPRQGRKLATFKPGGHWTRSLLPSPDGKKLYAGVGSLSNIAESGMEVEEGRAAIYELDLAERQEPHLCRRPAQRGGPGMGAADRRALDGGQRARRPRRRDAARLSDLGARRRLLRLALLLLGADGGRSGAAGSGRWSPRRSRRTTRWAGTPRRSACAGCRPARFPAFRTAWPSGSTAPGTAAR